MDRCSIDSKASDRDIEAHAVHSLASAALACTSAARTKRETRSQLISFEVMLPPSNELNSPER